MKSVECCLTSSTENVFWSRDVRNHKLILSGIINTSTTPDYLSRSRRTVHKNAHDKSYSVYRVVERCTFWMGENATHTVTFYEYPSRLCQGPGNVGDRAFRPSVTYAQFWRTDSSQFTIVLLSPDSLLVLHDAILIPTIILYLRQGEHVCESIVGNDAALLSNGLF